ncbi:MAG TPA: helix-turn-helix domain-containing protein [Acidimicrobiia bacterium]
MAVRTPTLEDAATESAPIESAPARRPRADAVRNRSRIIETAGEIFAVRGADASLEEIARGAGVGIGTLYRHFPTRDDLVEAVFHDRVAELEALAEGLLASDAPGEALATWLHAQLDQAATCRGLAAEAMLTMLAHRDAPSPCESMRQAGAALLARAQAAGEVRDGVEIDDLVRMVQAVTLAADESDDPETAERLFGFVLDGVRAR